MGLRHSETLNRQSVAIVGCLLLVSACSLGQVGWEDFTSCKFKYLTSDYPAALKDCEKALTQNPNSNEIKETIDQIRNSWAEQGVKDLDQLPVADIEGRFQKVNEALKLAPQNALALRRLKDVESLINEVRGKVEKVNALIDAGEFLSAQAALDLIRVYKLADVRTCEALLNNSLDAENKAAKFNSKGPGLFVAYRELWDTQNKSLGKKTKTLLSDVINSVNAQLVQQLSAKIESDGGPRSSKVSTKLAQYYRDLLLGSPGNFPPLDIAGSRLNIASTPVAIYSGLEGTAKRVRIMLDRAGLSKNAAALSSLPIKASRNDFEKFGLTLVIVDFQERIVETGRDKPETKTSEYIVSSRSVTNPRYQTAQRDYQIAQKEFSLARQQRCSGVIEEVLMCIPLRSAAEQKLKKAKEILDAMPAIIDEASRERYEYQEYNLGLTAKLQLKYQVFDFKRQLQHKQGNFELVKEERWQELRNVNAADASGLRNTSRDFGFRQNFTEEFRKEASAKLSAALINEIFFALRFRFKDSADNKDISEASEEGIHYLSATYSQKRASDMDIAAFVEANLLNQTLSSDSGYIKIRPAIPLFSSPASDPRFTLKQIEDFLKGSVAPRRVGDLAEERGIQFEVTDELKKRLIKLGANNELIERLDNL